MGRKRNGGLNYSALAFLGVSTLGTVGLLYFLFKDKRTIRQIPKNVQPERLAPEENLRYISSDDVYSYSY